MGRIPLNAIPNKFLDRIAINEFDYFCHELFKTDENFKMMTGEALLAVFLLQKSYEQNEQIRILENRIRALEPDDY